jgi:hypothetical protein
VKIPSDAIIPEAKLTQYLLVPKARNDKSKFLAQAGFTLENPDMLLRALRALIAQVDAVLDRTEEYGIYYQVIGILEGINGINLNVITIWIYRIADRQYQFVTLIPDKDTSR